MWPLAVSGVAALTVFFMSKCMGVSSGQKSGHTERRCRKAVPLYLEKCLLYLLCYLFSMQECIPSYFSAGVQLFVHKVRNFIYSEPTGSTVSEWLLTVELLGSGYEIETKYGLKPCQDFQPSTLD